MEFLMQRMNQSGFTLFEIAFAMAIVCLLATVMVMGQTLTVDSQVSRLESDFRSIQTAIYDSQDEAHRQGNMRKVSLASANNGNRNGNIDGNWNSSSGEYFQLWKYARSGAAAPGGADKIANLHAPLKLSGGVIAVSETYDALIAGLKGNYAICTSNIAGQVAKKLDLVMDDGNTASGLMRVTNSVGGMAIATDSIVKSATYMVCLGV
jgi:prepilin-type N-terminal cleavage/methylation domain-containing protein